MNATPLPRQTQQPSGDITALLQPINDEAPAGSDLRGNGIYRAIQEARRADDPSLPQGQWQRELKQADWQQVAAMAEEALQKQSKDLQLALWLLEAQIHLRGFAGLAPCVQLVRQLCEHYWADLYPPINGSDLEHRTNLFRWANAKLPTAIALLPFTQSSERDYSWNDWQRALRNQQLHDQGAPAEDIEGPEPAEIQSTLAVTATEWLQWQSRHIAAALDAFAQLDLCLGERCGEEAPSLSALTGLLEDMGQLLAAELQRRGLGAEAEASAGEEMRAQSDGESSTGEYQGETDADGRSEAYRQITLIADYLNHIEPHSPVPALLRQAVNWGNMDAAELYRELFAKTQGQLNIFELLGMQVSQEQ